MSPAPALSQERHAHFEHDDGDNHHHAANNHNHSHNNTKHDPNSSRKKTPTSRTVFLDEEDEDSEGAGTDKNKKKNMSPRTEDDDDDDDAAAADDGSSDDDDEDARMRSQAFQRHHASKSSIKKPSSSGGSGGVLVKRFDEYADFLTRSERSRRDKQSKPADLSAATASSGKVNWHSSLEASVKVLPEIDEDDASGLYLTRDLWERIDLDLELTKKRWENHAAGLIAFDFLNNTTRGMEAMLDELGSRKRDSYMSRHVKAVLNEQNRQRIHKEFYHAERMRKVAEQMSLQEEATRRGQADAEEAVNIWLGRSSESQRPVQAGAPAQSSNSKSTKAGSSGKKKKKNGGGFNLLSIFQGKHKK
jgi:hypothetical protein